LSRRPSSIWPKAAKRLLGRLAARMRRLRAATPGAAPPMGRPERTAILWFLGPSLLGLTVFVVLPCLDALRRSFANPLGQRLIGLENYRAVLGNPAFQLAARNTIRFVAICLPLLLLASLGLALLVSAYRGNARVFKTTYLLPMAIPVSSIVLLWQVLFHRQGLLNAFLVSVGGAPVDFIGSNAAFGVLIFSYLWKNSGYTMVLWLAGLGDISHSLYEAAWIDGAGSWQCFRHITLPGLRPTLFLTSVLSLLNLFRVFREAYLVAGSYPPRSIYLLQHLLNNWFIDLDVGRLCAAAVLLGAVVFLVILLLQRLWVREG